MPAFDGLLLRVGLAHGLVGVICLGLLSLDATPILGVHPASKPLKFAMSIAAFLVTMAVLLPTLSVSDGTRRLLSGAVDWLLAQALPQDLLRQETTRHIWIGRDRAFLEDERLVE